MTFPCPVRCAGVTVYVSDERELAKAVAMLASGYYYGRMDDIAMKRAHRTVSAKRIRAIEARLDILEAVVDVKAIR